MNASELTYLVTLGIALAAHVSISIYLLPGERKPVGFVFPSVVVWASAMLVIIYWSPAFYLLMSTIYHAYVAWTLLRSRGAFSPNAQDTTDMLTISLNGVWVDMPGSNDDIHGVLVIDGLIVDRFVSSDYASLVLHTNALSRTYKLRPFIWCRDLILRDIRYDEQLSSLCPVGDVRTIASLYGIDLPDADSDSDNVAADLYAAIWSHVKQHMKQ